MGVILLGVGSCGRERICWWRKRKERSFLFWWEFVVWDEMRWDLVVLLGWGGVGELSGVDLDFSLSMKRKGKRTTSLLLLLFLLLLLLLWLLLLLSLWLFSTGRKSFGFWVRKRERKISFWRVQAAEECRVSSEWENAITTSYFLCLSLSLYISIYIFFFFLSAFLCYCFRPFLSLFTSSSPSFANLAKLLFLPIFISQN